MAGTAPDDEALHAYGFSPVLLDAVKLRLHLPALNYDTLREVMQGPDFAARAFRFSETCLRMRLEFTECGLDALATHALELGRNAHSLESAIYGVLDHVSAERDKTHPGREVRR